jgi:glycogen debranching enzyme
MEDIDINDLLDNWYKAKQEISILENKCDKYKKVCEKLMDKLEKNSLNSTYYSLKKIDITKSTISKNNVPDDIWDAYSKKTKYSSFYLNPIKSPRRKKKSP